MSLKVKDCGRTYVCTTRLTIPNDSVSLTKAFSPVCRVRFSSRGAYVGTDHAVAGARDRDGVAAADHGGRVEAPPADPDRTPTRAAVRRVARHGHPFAPRTRARRAHLDPPRRGAIRRRSLP